MVTNWHQLDFKQKNLFRCVLGQKLFALQRNIIWCGERGRGVPSLSAVIIELFKCRNFCHGNKDGTIMMNQMIKCLFLLFSVEEVFLFETFCIILQTIPLNHFSSNWIASVDKKEWKQPNYFWENFQPFLLSFWYSALVKLRHSIPSKLHLSVCLPFLHIAFLFSLFRQDSEKLNKLFRKCSSWDVGSENRMPPDHQNWSCKFFIFSFLWSHFMEIWTIPHH